ncbi:ABC transporter ATP-binding protein [Kribbella sp. NPDC056861]|uniref:ABC transporter ATP-binding protein n=1 Tax=Kribbella sp. NPDC056861 TaxID=3154857 RepID=UPI00344069E7
MSVEQSRPDFLRTGLFALRLIWRADPRRFTAVVAVQLVTAVGLTASLLLIRHVLGIGLATGTNVGAAGKMVLPGVLIVLAVQAAGSVLRSVSQGWQRVLAVKTDRHLIDLVLRSAGRADLASYDDPAFYDRLQRAIFASRSEPITLVTGLAVFLRAGLGLIAVAGAFLALAWWLLPLCLLALLPVLVAARKERDARYRLHTSLAENRRGREYLERLLTTRDDAKEIKALDLGSTLRDRWSRGYGEEIRLTIEMHRDHLRRGIAARLLSDGVTAAIVAAGWLLVHQGLIDLATALAVLTALLLLSLRMKATAFLAGTLGDTLIYLADMRQFVDRQDDDEPAAIAPDEDGFSTLTADRVSFAYPGASEPVLRQISLTLRRGEVVALVGSNGSGKTTLAKLLAGLYSPADGQIRWDGVPVEDKATLRNSAAVVFQDFIRFKLAARDSITFGRPGLPPDAAAASHAAQRAGIDQKLENLPAGYDTPLSAEYVGGVDLSLGQWQRLALARAFYRNSPYVILDEPTASLDAQAEADLFDRVRDLFAGRTVLLISHRFSNVRRADHIYVLENGEILEHGTHESLIAEAGRYAHLYNLQADAYQPDPAG